MCANTVKKELCPSDPNVLVIFGSPHKNGPTARLLDAFLGALPQNSQIDRFDCFASSPLPCNDCRFCYKADGCALSDLDDFYGRLELADIVVFAAPVYNLSFPAPMKALIDRMQRYWAARFIRDIRPPIKLEKRAVLITSGGTDHTDGGALMERQLKPVLTVIHARLIKAVHYTGADQNRPLDPFIAEAVKAARLMN